MKNSCTYDEILEAIVNLTNDNLCDPDAEISDETESRIEIVIEIFPKKRSEIYSDLTDKAQEIHRLNREDDELQYGHLNEYGDSKDDCEEF
jgi:hypothetical protein